MSELTENLLKLTEFPFSYSLFALLALIFGEGVKFQALSLSNIGPLLVLITFLATTLSITDPIGAIQKRIMLGLNPKINSTRDLVNYKIFGTTIKRLFPPFYILMLAYTPENLRMELNPTIIHNILQKWGEGVPDMDLEDEFVSEIIKINRPSAQATTGLLVEFEHQTVRTKWITAEVDRITALVYYVTIILLFIIAALLHPTFLPKFGEYFGNFETVGFTILIFSFIALLAICYATFRRFQGLRSRSLIVYRYLTALQISKTNEDLNDNIKEIERHLGDGEWILAQFETEEIEALMTSLLMKNLTK